MSTTVHRRSRVVSFQPLVPLLLSLAVVTLPGRLHAQAGGRAAPAGGCPQIGVPTSPSIFVWRDGKIRREATLKFFAMECLPVHHPAAEMTCEGGVHCTAGAYTDYAIVATADFEASGDGTAGKAFPIEAVSARGVVLGSGIVIFDLGELRYHKTTRILLSEAEVQRVVKLTIGEPSGTRD